MFSVSKVVFVVLYVNLYLVMVSNLTLFCSLCFVHNYVFDSVILLNIVKMCLMRSGIMGMLLYFV